MPLATVIRSQELGTFSAETGQHPFQEIHVKYFLLLPIRSFFSFLFVFSAFAPVYPFVLVLGEYNHQNPGHQEMEERDLEQSKPLDGPDGKHFSTSNPGTLS